MNRLELPGGSKRYHKIVYAPEKIFANPATNKTLYPSEIQKRYIKPLGIKFGLGAIGWHTFRHTYRSWLDETEHR